ncbi:MAG: 4-hydroxythreonine-4-phosphate dehydrogenase PdxA [Lentimicrobiaceae bacterium]|nr:4-hydroxythreonine-4-phosphate dehydrogenase PdxA [Lentimicrobiaceae bacterium]
MAEKPILAGITQGDINGIGYEVITKVLADSRMLEVCTPLVYGNSKSAAYHRKLIKNCGDFTFNIVRQPNQASLSKSNLINVSDIDAKVELGIPTEMAGKMALDALKTATEHVLEKNIDVLVTAPINKHTIRSDAFDFPGHTEYLAKASNVNNYLMLMVADNLRIGTVTTHCALSEVPAMLSKELIVKKLRVLNNSLKNDFACTSPKIAVLSLNPHAGDDSLFGKEEKEIIVPAVETAFEQGMYAFGPYSADGFFGSGQYAKFDAVLAMYHDQAMIPFKILSYGEGVNFTAGLPFVRTAPAHGTAYEIAGKDMASPDSFRKAIYVACDIFRNRKRDSA